MSTVRTSIAAESKMERRQLSKAIAWPKHTGESDLPSRGQSRMAGISPALVADRLRCMLEHIQGNRTRQVLLDVVALASTLQPISAQVEVLRDMVQEAHGLFLRGNHALAERQLHDALDHLETNQGQAFRAGVSQLRRRIARA